MSAFSQKRTLESEPETQIFTKLTMLPPFHENALSGTSKGQNVSFRMV